MTGLGRAAEPKPFASLSSGLLARKGQAKPAMRPQGFGGFGHMAMGHEDLGWNDMGYDVGSAGDDEAAPAKVELPRILAFSEDDHREEADPPAVLSQRQALADGLGAEEDDGDEEAELEAAPFEAPVLRIKPRALSAETVAAHVVPVAAPAPRGRKAAFTLRLDADRHLKLRLACAVNNSSAQQIVTAALDHFLDRLPELDQLAERVPGRGRA